MLTCATLVVGLTLTSYHLDRDAGYNEFNPGVYALCDGWTAGIYVNSLSRPSVFAGKAWEWGRFSLALGAVTGYRKKVMPMVFPTVRVGENLRVGFIPPVEPKSKGALTLSVEFP